MPVIINGSTGISGTDGSAATPAVQGTDTNTGMFFPAADQIAFAEGGVEVMRLDASGNVGIGTATPTATLDINNIANTQNSLKVSGYGFDLATVGTSGFGGTFSLARGGDGVETVRIRSNADSFFNGGNVGIGTSSASARLHVNGTSGSPQARLGTSAGYYEINAFDGNPVYMVVNGTNHTSGVIGTQSNTPFAFFTNNTERGRFTAGGDFQFNSGYGSVATAFGCRAWVNFNGTGTVAIRASGNVSSITDNGTGAYTVNFTTAMPDANYNVVGMSGSNNAASNGSGFSVSVAMNSASPFQYSTSGVRVFTGVSNSAPSDNAYVLVSIFR